MFLRTSIAEMAKGTRKPGPVPRIRRNNKQQKQGHSFQMLDLQTQVFLNLFKEIKIRKYPQEKLETI